MLKLIQINFYIVIILGSFTSMAQKASEKIKYKSDAVFGSRENGKAIRRLEGNVVFTQKSSTMYCDRSVYYVKDNIMEAYGHVRIIDDSVKITADRLTYYGGDQSARLRQNVVYTKGEKILNTDFLDYNVSTEIGNYFHRGTLRDATNVLKCEVGYFYGKENYSIFWNNVILEAPDYILKSDTLRYNNKTKVATTIGRTEIITEDKTTLHANGGEFRTEFDQSAFINGIIETTDYFMEADKLFFDDIKKYYDAAGNVKLTSKKQDIIITGDEGYSDDNNGISKVYGNALMKRILEKDTMYLSADTLVSIESDYDSAKRVLAYPNVKVWKFNLQGLADSASYFLDDSLLFFYDDPVFWNRRNQMEGDTIVSEITDEGIKTMKLLQSAFIIGEDTINNYNQVKGRTMKAFFETSEISHIYVNGNVENIYYVLDEDDPNDIQTMGMNKILCSDMTIRFKNEKVDNISFYVRPEAKFIPPHELTEDIQKLQGFLWRNDERPELEDLLNNTPSPKQEKPNTALPPPEKIKPEGTEVDKKKQVLKNIKDDR